jgi:hypothetical protein
VKFGHHPPDIIRGVPPIPYRKCTAELISEFRDVLEKAEDERALQQFFERNLAILLLGLVAAHRSWVFPRASLPKPEGGAWIPDFMICDWGSLGPRWTIVELESPRRSATTQSGSVSAICNHAREQIEDYRRHLKKHASLLRDGGWPIDGGKCRAWIVIGRRFEGRTELSVERLSSLRDYDIDVASYDRLVSECDYVVKAEQASKKGLEELVKRVKGRAAKSSPSPPSRK